MAARLSLFNEALRLLGERRLTSVTEARDARYHLDDAYDTGVAYCLEQGFWNFAMRAVQIDASIIITPDFGFSFAFEKPTDWVRTYIISPDDRLVTWVPRMNDEAGVLYSDVDPMYMRYISNHNSYGMDLGNWPETFAFYVSSRLALLTAPSISSMSEDKLEKLAKVEKKARAEARNKDAMNEGPVRRPMDTWAASRSRDRNDSYAVAGGRVF